MFSLARKTQLTLAFLILSPAGVAGWFGPNPAESYYHHNIVAEKESCHNDEITFDERGTYLFGAILTPTTPFFENGVRVELPEIPFRVSLKLKQDDRVLFGVEQDIVLKRHTGLNLGRAKAPDELPRDTRLSLEICTDVNTSLYKQVYGPIRFWINKGAYWSVLD